MAESLESLVENFRINLTETIRKLEEENDEKKRTLETKHEQEIDLLGVEEKLEKEELDAKQIQRRKDLTVKEKIEKEKLDAKQNQRRKDLTVKQHQEKGKLMKDYEKKMKAIKENKTYPNTSNKEVPECPICLEPMNPPMRIFQCSHGHYLCEDCNSNKEIKSCPTCRRQIVGRNIGMEQAIQLMSASPDRPRGHQSEVTQNQRNTGVQNDDGGLTCDNCTFINQEGAQICELCRATLGIVFLPSSNRRGPVDTGEDLGVNNPFAESSTFRNTFNSFDNDEYEVFGCRLFVYGISENVQRDEMEEEFGRCGTVTNAYNTGKGYAFITYSCPIEAQDCLRSMNGRYIFGQTLTIDMAKGTKGTTRGPQGDQTLTINLAKGTK